MRPSSIKNVFTPREATIGSPLQETGRLKRPLDRDASRGKRIENLDTRSCVCEALDALGCAY